MNRILTGVVLLILSCLSLNFLAKDMNYITMYRGFNKVYENLIPKAPKNIKYSAYRDADIHVAKVFGRNSGCRNVDADFIREVSKVSREYSINPELLASVIAVESSCNPYAISHKGAVGLMQINLKVWNQDFDFKEEYNLFNAVDNLRVGAQILSRYISQYGEREALERYQGLGSDRDTEYLTKVEFFAGQ